MGNIITKQMLTEKFEILLVRIRENNHDLSARMEAACLLSIGLEFQIFSREEYTSSNERIKDVEETKVKIVGGPYAGQIGRLHFLSKGRQGSKAKVWLAEKYDVAHISWKNVKEI